MVMHVWGLLQVFAGLTCVALQLCACENVQLLSAIYYFYIDLILPDCLL